MSKKSNRVANALNKALSNSYALMQIAHLYHWNVVGPQFISFHTFFEEQYTELFTAVDDLAERLRALELMAPASLAELRGNAKVGDVSATGKALDMIAGYKQANDIVIEGLRELSEAASETGDTETEDMAIARLQVHTKTAWMLRAILK